MKVIKFLVITSFFLAIFACSSGGGDSSSAPSISAPNSVSGKTYVMGISSGTGVFATTGGYTVTFSNSQNIYAVTGDGVNVEDSNGTFTYVANNNQGIATIVDSVVANGIFTFTFNTENSGTFQVTVESDAASNQSGTFTEQ